MFDFDTFAADAFDFDTFAAAVADATGATVTNSEEHGGEWVAVTVNGDLAAVTDTANALVDFAESVGAELTWGVPDVRPVDDGYRFFVHVSLP